MVLYSCTSAILGALYAHACKTLSSKQSMYGVYVLPCLLVMIWLYQDMEWQDKSFGLLLWCGIGMPCIYIGHQMGSRCSVGDPPPRGIGCAGLCLKQCLLWMGCNGISLGLLYATSTEIQLMYISKDWWLSGRTLGLLMLNMSMYTILFSMVHTYIVLRLPRKWLPIYWQSYLMPQCAFVLYAWWDVSLVNTSVWVIVLCGTFQGSISWFVSNCFIHHIIQSIKME